MKYTSLAGGTVQTFVLAFDPEDRVIEDLTAFAKAEKVTAARFAGIGGFSEAVLGYFDRAARRYEPIAIDEQVELLSLIGNVSLQDGAPLVHAHVVVGHRGGSVSGGHLLQAKVWPTLELFVEIYTAQLVKLQRPELGLATLALDQTIA